jgi:hypothetical protein
LEITIPEYPALVGLKAGDVLILPETSQLRDWVVISINRTFNAGLNMLDIKCGRPIKPEPFVQPQVLAKTPKDPMLYYYGPGQTP